MAKRVHALVSRVNIVEDLGITGGVAKNIAVVKNLEKILGIKFREFPEDPQIMGALGAAIYARNRYLKRRKRA